MEFVDEEGQVPVSVSVSVPVPSVIILKKDESDQMFELIKDITIREGSVYVNKLIEGVQIIKARWNNFCVSTDSVEWDQIRTDILTLGNGGDKLYSVLAEIIKRANSANKNVKTESFLDKLASTSATNYTNRDVNDTSVVQNTNSSDSEDSEDEPEPVVKNRKIPLNRLSWKPINKRQKNNGVGKFWTTSQIRALLQLVDKYRPKTISEIEVIVKKINFLDGERTPHAASSYFRKWLLNNKLTLTRYLEQSSV